MQLEKILDFSVNWILTEGVKIGIGLLVLSIGWKLIKKFKKFINSLMDKM